MPLCAAEMGGSHWRNVAEEPCSTARRIRFRLKENDSLSALTSNPTPPRSRRHALTLNLLIDQSTPLMTPHSSETRGRPPEQSVVFISPVKAAASPSRRNISRHSATRLICSGFTASESFSLMHFRFERVLFQRNVPSAPPRYRKDQNF